MVRVVTGVLFVTFSLGKFVDHAAESARPCQPNHDDNQMHQKDQELPHLGNRIKLQPTLDFARVLGIRHGQENFCGRVRLNG